MKDLLTVVLFTNTGRSEDGEGEPSMAFGEKSEASVGLEYNCTRIPGHKIQYTAWTLTAQGI